MKTSEVEFVDCVLPDLWRSKATELRSMAGAEGAARALEHAAKELTDWLTASDNRIVTPAEAAEIVNRSPETILKDIRHGRLEQAGRKNSPRVRVRDLKKRYGSSRVVGRPDTGYDPVLDARFLLSR